MRALLSIALFLACLSPGLAQTPVPALAIMPLGTVPDKDLAAVRESIERAYGWRTLLLPSRPLPKAAFYAPRRRHRAEKILNWLRPKKPRAAQKIMGVTAKDISTTKGHHKDWGICGLAELAGEASVVSTLRIKGKLGKAGSKKRREKYRQRLTDLATHEFGHQLGLGHCPNRGCIMEDAKGTVRTFDHSTGELCADCKHRLAELGHALPK